MSGERARLDASLARRGQTIKLRRRIGKTDDFVDVDCRARIDGLNPDGSPLPQQESRAIISPSEIIAAGWSSGRAAPEDTRVPMKGNVALINGRPCQVEGARGIYVSDELVRIELVVKG